jgi:hypothetical protein
MDKGRIGSDPCGSTDHTTGVITFEDVRISYIPTERREVVRMPRWLRRFLTGFAVLAKAEPIFTVVILLAAILVMVGGTGAYLTRPSPPPRWATTPEPSVRAPTKEGYMGSNRRAYLIRLSASSSKGYGSIRKSCAASSPRYRRPWPATGVATVVVITAGVAMAATATTAFADSRNMHRIDTDYAQPRLTTAVTSRA